MAKFNDPQEAEAAAQKLLQGRMDYVRRAIDARNALEEAQEQLKAAERTDTAAYQAAVKNGGWGEDELKKIGLTQPTKVKLVQQRKRSNGTISGGSEQRESKVKDTPVPNTDITEPGQTDSMNQA
ncbi:hypothetical protein [Kocuria sp.]|uniref:hypothetical protein n=1 Tax=Kocuria sp. TaxID=1871328 RepID=UPI0028AAD68A|nr:hypothetical protein [Kocuria sp.]